MLLLLSYHLPQRAICEKECLEFLELALLLVGGSQRHRRRRWRLYSLLPKPSATASTLGRSKGGTFLLLRIPNFGWPFSSVVLLGLHNPLDSMVVYGQQPTRRRKIEISVGSTQGVAPRQLFRVRSPNMTNVSMNFL